MTKQERIQALKENQAKWMNQRRTATEIDEAKTEALFESFPHTETQSLSCSPKRQGKETFHQNFLPDGVSLTKLTEKITSRIRDEIEDELRRSSSSITTADSSAKLANHLEDYLSSELHTHSCQICYELMMPPALSPMLLFPCGHTFCKKCVHKCCDSIKTPGEDTRCPYCREKIVSVAENQSLKYLIERFASQKEQLEKKTANNLQDVFFVAARDAIEKKNALSSSKYDEDHEKTCFENDRLRNKYTATFRSCLTRHVVLGNEKKELEGHTLGYQQRLAGVTAAMDMLEKERGEVKARMSALQAELDSIDLHMEEQQEKERSFIQKKTKHESKMRLIEAAMKNLETEMEKTKALGEGVGSNPDDFYEFKSS